MVAHLLILRNGRHEPGRQVLGVAGHVPDTADTVHTVHGLQQVREVHAHALAVGIYVLAQQSNFRDPPLRQRADLGNHFLQRPGPLPPPHVGYDAVGAEVVAAEGDVDESRERIGSVGGQALAYGEALLLREDQPLVVQCAQHQLRQPPQHVGAEDEVHEGEPPHDLLRHIRLLHHAAADTQDQPRVLLLPLLQRADVGQQPLFRMVPHTAGVEQNDVGRVPALGGRVAHLLQQPRDGLGIPHVHLAAICLDIIGLPPAPDPVKDLLGHAPLQLYSIWFDPFCLHLHTAPF